MTALLGDPFRKWEEEARQAAVRGFEGLLPAPSEWDSFLSVAAPDLLDAGMGLPWETGAELGATDRIVPPAAASPDPAIQPGLPPDLDPAATADQPDAKLPEDLRAEIEGFLKRDGPTPATDDEVKAFLKGGIDPNLDPEK